MKWIEAVKGNIEQRRTFEVEDCGCFLSSVDDCFGERSSSSESLKTTS